MKRLRDRLEEAVADLDKCQREQKETPILAHTNEVCSFSIIPESCFLLGDIVMCGFHFIASLGVFMFSLRLSLS